MPTDTTAPLTDWLRLVRAEYLEDPGLHLTRAQIQRLWGLDAQTCDALIHTLVESRFLRRTAAHRYGRSDAGA
jgi:DNA-binding IclR family transcriptional regulator